MGEPTVERLVEVVGTLPLLRSGAEQLGFLLSERQLEQFQLYYEILVDWNARVNLTAITDYDGVQVRHFVDSLTVASALRDELTAAGKGDAPPRGFSLIDVGTGGGFPGVPLKILWPQLRVALSDSVGKKTLFLRELVTALSLDGVEVVTGRAEDLGVEKRRRERYDAATARAVASLPVLCEYCLPLVRVGGWMLAPKKGDIADELKGGKAAAQKLGGGEIRSRGYRIGGEVEDRFVIAIKKVRPTPPAYPRRVGLAKQKPLG